MKKIKLYTILETKLPKPVRIFIDVLSTRQLRVHYKVSH